MGSTAAIRHIEHLTFSPRMIFSMKCCTMLLKPWSIRSTSPSNPPHVTSWPGWGKPKQPMGSRKQPLIWRRLRSTEKGEVTGKNGCYLASTCQKPFMRVRPTPSSQALPTEQAAPQIEKGEHFFTIYLMFFRSLFPKTAIGTMPDQVSASWCQPALACGQSSSPSTTNGLENHVKLPTPTRGKVFKIDASFLLLACGHQPDATRGTGLGTHPTP